MRGFEIEGLGEIAIRCADMDAMVAFYRDVIGLPILSDSRGTADIVFFRIGAEQAGVGGHTTVLALFKHDAQGRDVHPEDAGQPATGARSSLHHIALTVHAEQQDAVIAWYEAKNQPYKIEGFGWIGWRGVFTNDPEGNTVEIVAHHENWKTADPD